MSRAFVKEDVPDTSPLPDLPVPAGPNWVTPSGLARLRERAEARRADLVALRARPDRTDRLPEAAAERDLRYLEARLASAIPVEPDPRPGEVAFGVAATVEDEAGRRRVLRIVGEDEADPAQGRISPQSPLAQALIGAGAGEEVEWRGGTLRVLALAPSD